MTKMQILYVIAGLNGAALLVLIAGTIEIFRWGHRKKHDR